MSQKAKSIIGWIMTVLVGLFLLVASAVPKFIDWEGKDEMMGKIGIPLELLPTIGVLEVVVTLLYLIPRTSFLGAILLTGYLGGAILTHVRIGDPWFFPVIIGVWAWVALALRNGVLFRLLLGFRVEAATSSGSDR